MARYSKLAPFTLAEKLTICDAAINCFAMWNYAKVCTLIGREFKPGLVESLDGADFLKFLDVTRILPDPDRYYVPLRELLERLEMTGVLTFRGFGQDALIGKRYWFMKELTQLQVKGKLWLAPVLGAEFLHLMYAPFTHQITGKSLKGDEHAGTALAIAPNWLLTCGHVVRDMVVDEVQMLGGLPCHVVETLWHPSVDVALLKLESPIPVMPDLAFRDPLLSEPLFTLGYPRIPLAREAPLVMQSGEVTAQEVRLLFGEEVFLFSAVARPGNSGGPILSSSGHVVGIVTQHLEARDVNSQRLRKSRGSAEFDGDGVERSERPGEPQAGAGASEGEPTAQANVREVPNTSPILPFYAGISTGTLVRALADLAPSIQLPVETYE